MLKDETAEDLLDLSKAEGNILVSSDVMDSISFQPKDFSVLPDKHKYTQLIDSIAQLNNVPSDCVVLGNGSDELIDQIAYSRAGSTSLTLVPSFERLFEVNLKYKYKTHKFPLPFAEDYLYSEDFHIDFIEELYRIHPDLLWLCSPNNPTGTIIDPTYIKDISNKFPKTWIVVDMAFMNIADEKMTQKYNSLIKTSNNILLLNSFSKSWGIGLLRVGYLISDAKISHSISKRNVMYNVNGVALETAINCLKKPDYRISEYLTINRHLDEIKKCIELLPQFEIISNSKINLFCIRHKSMRNLYQILIERGIKTKLLDKMPGMEDMGYCRVMIPRNGFDLDKLISALKEI